MDTTPEQIQPIQKYNKFALGSFVLGLVTMIFPTISILFLLAANGGAGYLQSIFCGVPVAFVSIIAGIVALVQIRRKNQPGTGKGAWMAIVGIVLGILSFGIMWFLVAYLILPFFMGTAN